MAAREAPSPLANGSRCGWLSAVRVIWATGSYQKLTLT